MATTAVGCEWPPAGQSARTGVQKLGGIRLSGLYRVVGEGAAGTWLATLGQPKPCHGFDVGMGAACPSYKIVSHGAREKLLKLAPI